MNTLTPSRARTQQRAVSTDLHSNTNDYSSSARSKATTTSPLYTTVDNLLLPGVIGATVEGPKTPIRSPKAKRVLDFFPHTNTNSAFKKNRMSFPSSPFAVPQSRRASGNYIDTEVALDRPSSLGFGRGTPKNNGHTPQTPQGKQYRKAFRPHDTPIAGSKRPQSNNNIDNPRTYGSNGRKSGGPTSYLYRPSPFVDDQVNYDEDDDDDKENRPRSANFRSRQETDRAPTDQFEPNEDHPPYSRERHQFDNVKDEKEEDPRDNLERNAYEDDDEGLDIGEQEDEIYSHERLRGNNYQDAVLDDQDNESFDEREIAELKREQEQLGFIKRWAHLLRKQRDEFGWGNSKQQDGYPSEGSDIDSDTSFTSARVRKEPYQRKKTPVASRLSKVVAVPASASKSPSPEPRSPTPQLASPQSQPTSPRSQSTPSRSQATSHRSPSKSPFNIPSMRQFDSGIGLDGSQESHDEAELLEELPEEEEIEEAVDISHMETGDMILQDVYRSLERLTTPSPRPSSRTSAFKEEEDERPYITERYGHHSDTSDYESDTEHRSRYEVNLGTKHPIEPRYNWHYETAHSPLYQSTEAPASARVYPWHVVGHAVEGYMDTLQHFCHSLTTGLEHYAWTIFTWILFIILWPWSQRHTVWKVGESWIQAGVSSGLLRPGTLFGVALLGLAVWASHKFGYEGVSGTKDGRACNNETVLPSSGRGPLLKEIVFSTWDKISWPGTSNRDGRSRVSNPRRWSDWVPSVPSVDKWIPFRKTSKYSPSPSSTIQIPTEQIHSLEELESRIELIQKTLVDLGHADDRLDKELHSKLKGMSVWVSGVEHKLNIVSNKVDSLKEYISDGRWIEQTVLDLVRDEIPRHLVVAKDPRTGKLSIPSEFWDTARELFMTSDQVQQSIKDQVALLDQDSDDQHEDDSSSGRWSWGSSRGKKKPGKAISWDDFLLENEKAMSSFVEGRMSKVSRSVFLALVRTEANLIWQSLEKNVVTLLEKQGKLEGKAAPARGGYDSSNSDNNNFGRTLTDIERDLISGLIDKALEKYSADALAKPDYALHSAGGRIIPRLTSPNYFHYVEPTLLGRLGARFFVPLPRREKPAEKAIEPDMHAGECWAMDGQEGQLAVRLARKIVITEVTIEHADPSVVLDLGSAAREIEIWGLRGRSDAAPVTPQSSRPHDTPSSSTETDKQEQESKQETKSGAATPSSKPGSWWREGAPWPGSTLLTTIEFNANMTTASSNDSDVSEKPKSRQTFSIPLSKQTVPSVGAVFRIKSNWGHPKMTCIYRVRVHGYEPTDTPEQQ
ncbi:hypothetical protein BG015_006729 [Linnemannia schmuckeri]|uniref:SUN domain-containing protein n=1 Tax=Linnemannia schmuckeri TaxID=64567 RepID=A0A9P5RZD2_9FUNG|nr:hypothetical protein BG015_006729 [Linnemannia schmuckeri]